MEGEAGNDHPFGRASHGPPLGSRHRNGQPWFPHPAAAVPRAGFTTWSRLRAADARCRRSLASGPRDPPPTTIGTLSAPGPPRPWSGPQRQPWVRSVIRLGNEHRQLCRPSAIPFAMLNGSRQVPGKGDIPIAPPAPPNASPPGWCQRFRNEPTWAGRRAATQSRSTNHLVLSRPQGGTRQPLTHRQRLHCWCRRLAPKA